MRLSAAPSGHRYGLDISGAGPPLLLLHGFSGSRRTWRDIAPSLSDDFRLITLDILGHGESDKPPHTDSYRLSNIAADIIDLLDQLEIKRIHLLGYSMGGRLALCLALHQPARFSSLVLESASPGLADPADRKERRRRDETLAGLIETRGADWFAGYWERLPLWDTQTILAQEVVTEQRQQRARNDPLGLAHCLRAMGTGAQTSLWDDLPALTIPTLLLVGELDAKFRRINQAMALPIPNASLVVLPATGHNTHLENPSAFAEVVSAFLQRA